MHEAVADPDPQPGVTMTTIEQVTDEQRDALLEAACDIRKQAYAPY